MAKEINAIQWRTTTDWISWYIPQDSTNSDAITAKCGEGTAGEALTRHAVDTMEADLVSAGGYIGAGVWSPADLDHTPIGGFAVRLWSQELCGRMSMSAYERWVRRTKDDGVRAIRNEEVGRATIASMPCVIAYQWCTDLSNGTVYPRNVFSFFPTWTNDHIRIEYSTTNAMFQEKFDAECLYVAESLLLGPE